VFKRFLAKKVPGNPDPDSKLVRAVFLGLVKYGREPNLVELGTWPIAEGGWQFKTSRYDLYKIATSFVVPEPQNPQTLPPGETGDSEK
jgi:hypothetical protein